MLRAMYRTPWRIRRIPEVLVDFCIGGASTGGLASLLRQNVEALHSRQSHMDAPTIDAAFFLKWARKIAQFVLPAECQPRVLRGPNNESFSLRPASKVQRGNARFSRGAMTAHKSEPLSRNLSPA